MRLLADLNLGAQYPHLDELTNTFKRHYLEVVRVSSNLSSNSSGSRGSRLKSELIKDNQRDRINRARAAVNAHSQQELFQAESENREMLN